MTEQTVRPLPLRMLRARAFQTYSTGRTLKQLSFFLQVRLSRGERQIPLLKEIHPHTKKELKELKIDNTFVPGRTDRIQTIVSWKTNEPSNSVVYFEEGSGLSSQKILANSASSSDVFGLNHNVIITNFRPGSIYRIQVASTDTAGNKTLSPIRVIITPQLNRSIFEVILKNFENTFQFLQ